MAQKRWNPRRTFLVRTEDIGDGVFGSMGEMVTGRKLGNNFGVMSGATGYLLGYLSFPD